MSYLGSKKRKALSRAINCMLGAAVLAGGMFGNAGIVSAADPDPTAMYKGGEFVSPYIVQKTGEKLEIKAYNRADVDFGEYKAYTSGAFCGAYVNGYIPHGISIVTGGNVIMTGGTVGYIYGGFGINVANVSGNIVKINGGCVNKFYVYGGFATGGGNATKNIVVITGNDSVVNGSVYGGNVGSSGNAENNEVNISSGSQVKKYTNPGASPSGGNVYGGIVNASGKAVNNRVNISDSEVEVDVYGGNVGSSGDAENNRVNISDSTIGNNVYGGNVEVSGNAENNRVNIAGGKVTENVYGGYTLTGNANNNIVNISGGEFKNIYGGRGSGNGASVSGNKVIIENAKITGAIYGGEGKANPASVSGNTVVINNSSVGGEVYGGKIEAAPGKIVENNTVIIGGGSTVKGNVYATGYGGPGTAGAGTVILNGAKIEATVLGNYTDYTDKTLNICSLNNKVTSFWNFDTINFYVPKDAKNNATMLTTTSGSPIDLANVKTIRAGVANWSTLKKGDVINLITTMKGLENVSADMMTTDTVDEVTKKAEIIGTGLVKIDGTVKVTDDNKSIILEMNENIGPSETSKTLVETRAGGMALLNNGADMAVGKGFMNAQAAAEADGDSNGASTGGFTTYAAIGGANMRYETGSYVDSKGWGINVGLSRIINNKNSKLTLAPFIEYGKASYDSYLENAVNTHGSGDNSFTGIGFMAKNEQKDGFYYEGSVRFGRAKGDYQGDTSTFNSKYDTASNYLAFHAGIGKVQKVNEKSSIDYYGKFFYTNQGEDTVTIQSTLGPAEYDFDTINSYRLRLGTRWNQKLGAKDVFYAGLAWDYEFDSEARAHYNGMSTPAPSMKGSSGMLELGWKQEVTKDNPFGVDLGVTGWCGKQRGISFNAGFSWAF